MNSVKAQYETCPQLHPRSFKADRSTPSDSNKENYTQSEQPDKKSQSKAQGLSEKIFNLKEAIKQKDPNIEGLVESIEKMEEHQQACIRELNLKEAQEVKEKVIELRRELMLKRRQQIEDKYQQEVNTLYESLMEKLTESQVQEMNDFNEFWDQKVGEFEIEANCIEKEMLERHQQEQLKVEDELRKVIPMKKKVSTQYLNYKKSMENLVKQKEFIEAEQIRVLCEELSREERNKAYAQKEQRIKFFMSQLDQRHKNELNVLRKRISTGREELLKAKVLELEKLLHKFQNTRTQLEQEKQLELSRFEVTQKNYFGGDEASYRSSCKGISSRTSRRPSKNTLRIRDTSKLHSLNISMMSPTSHILEVQQFSHASPSVNIGKHKRSFTNVGKGLNIIDMSGSTDYHSETKTKRANSVIKQ